MTNANANTNANVNIDRPLAPCGICHTVLNWGTPICGVEKIDADGNRLGMNLCVECFNREWNRLKNEGWEDVFGDDDGEDDGGNDDEEEEE